MDEECLVCGQVAEQHENLVMTWWACSCCGSHYHYEEDGSVCFFEPEGELLDNDDPDDDLDP